MAQFFTPVVYLFLITIIGTGIGKVKIKGVSLGAAGILGISLLFGALANSVGYINIGDENMALYDMSQKSIYSFLSSLGSSFFISIVGIEAGIGFLKSTKVQKLKAFSSGVVTVIFGSICAVLIYLFDNRLSRELLLGIFSGSMTSTPALSAVCDISQKSSEAVAGYGISYSCGLFSIVVFVKLLSRMVNKNKPIPNKSYDSCFQSIDALPIVAISVLIGYLLKSILPIGTTGCVLLVGIFAGILVFKRKRFLLNCDMLRELGLIMFFVGSGVPAGAELVDLFSPRLLIYGFAISLSAIIGGYIFARKILLLDMQTALCVLCGGMTSTPAIGILKKSDDNVDLSLYAVSYTGAIIFLIISVRLIFGLI